MLQRLASSSLSTCFHLRKARLFSAGKQDITPNDRLADLFYTAARQICMDDAALPFDCTAWILDFASPISTSESY